jgi:Fe-S-cluster containining protein
MIPDLDPYAERVDPAIQCGDCAAVCCRLTVVLMPEDSVPAWLTDTDDRGLETMAKGRDGWCVAVDPDSRRCTIYERRPQLCRKFAMGGPYCRDERSNWFADPTHAIPLTVL